MFAISILVIIICTVTFVRGADVMLVQDWACNNRQWVNETFAAKQHTHNFRNEYRIEDSLGIGLNLFELLVNRYCSSYFSSHAPNVDVEKSMLGNLGLIADEILSCSNEYQRLIGMPPLFQKLDGAVSSLELNAEENCIFLKLSSVCRSVMQPIPIMIASWFHSQNQKSVEILQSHHRLMQKQVNDYYNIILWPLK